MSSANPAQGNRAARARADLDRAAPPPFLAALHSAAARSVSQTQPDVSQPGGTFSSFSASGAAPPRPSTKSKRPQHTEIDSAAADARQFRKWANETAGPGFDAPEARKEEMGRDATLRDRLIGRGRGGKVDEGRDGKKKGARRLEEEDDDEDEGRSGLGKSKRRAKRRREDDEERADDVVKLGDNETAPDREDDIGMESEVGGIPASGKPPEQAGDHGDSVDAKLASGDVLDPVDAKRRKRNEKKRRKKKQQQI